MGPRSKDTTQLKHFPAWQAGFTGSCSSDDEALMTKLGGGNGAGSFPKIVADCGFERGISGQGLVPHCVWRSP